MINSTYCQKRIVSLHLNEGLLLAVAVVFWDGLESVAVFWGPVQLWAGRAGSWGVVL